MASLAQGIVGGDMAWPLVVAGILMGFAMIMFKVKSPMLVAIGMYLPIATTSAIFVGGVIRWFTDSTRRRARLQRSAERARGERGRAGRLRPDRRRSPGRPGDRHVQLPGLTAAAGVLKHPIYLAGIVVMALIALSADSHPAEQRRRPE